jgi:hypothetical protein
MIRRRQELSRMAGLDEPGFLSLPEADRAPVNWVEKGVAPGVSVTITGGEKSLPLCSYPSYPRYRGGVPALSTSYECATAQRNERRPPAARYHCCRGGAGAASAAALSARRDAPSMYRMP